MKWLRYAVLIAIAIGSLGSTLFWFRTHNDVVEEIFLPDGEGKEYIISASRHGVDLKVVYFLCDMRFGPEEGPAFPPAPAWRVGHRSHPDGFPALAPTRVDFRFAGFRVAAHEWSGTDENTWGQYTNIGWLRGLLVPYWFAPTLLATLVGYRIIRGRVIRRRIRLRTMGRLCQNCGYDLRGSADRCPECGTAVPIPEAGTQARLAHQ